MFWRQKGRADIKYFGGFSCSLCEVFRMLIFPSCMPADKKKLFQILKFVGGWAGPGRADITHFGGFLCRLGEVSDLTVSCVMYAYCFKFSFQILKFVGGENSPGEYLEADGQGRYLSHLTVKEISILIISPLTALKPSIPKFLFKDL